MARTIKTWRDPYDAGFSTTRPREITINPGVTILVGCNGAGKTTLINNIQEELNKNQIPYMKFNNLTDGHTHAADAAMYRGEMALTATILTSSEGENILNSLSSTISHAANFIKTGKSSMRYTRRQNDDYTPPNERWFFFDAIDSGSSIDNIIDLKAIFPLMQNTANSCGVDLYIIISANSYEMACGENCFDVMSGKYISFNSYDEYKKFILKTRTKKEKRYAKQQ